MIRKMLSNGQVPSPSDDQFPFSQPKWREASVKDPSKKIRDTHKSKRLPNWGSKTKLIPGRLMSGTQEIRLGRQRINNPPQLKKNTAPDGRLIDSSHGVKSLLIPPLVWCVTWTVSPSLPVRGSLGNSLASPVNRWLMTDWMAIWSREEEAVPNLIVICKWCTLLFIQRDFFCGFLDPCWRSSWIFGDSFERDDLLPLEGRVGIQMWPIIFYWDGAIDSTSSQAADDGRLSRDLPVNKRGEEEEFYY